MVLTASYGRITNEVRFWIRNQGYHFCWRQAWLKRWGMATGIINAIGLVAVFAGVIGAFILP
jgi:hypothetical protein